MIIAHNLAGMNSKRMLNITDNKKAKSTQRLSSGYRINRAADDAAGLSISEKMRQQIRGLNQGSQNIKEGIGYCQVADGALDEIQNMLHRLTELSVQAANGTLSPGDREDINEEIKAIKGEMSKICATTKYNEEYIFTGGGSSGEPYELEFSGILKDIFVYNDTFSNSTATYGGIAYEGKRYEWNSIDPDMYDQTTNTFKEGTYTLTADDGSYVNLICKDGTQPPEIQREFTTNADDNGIYINNEFISWNKVTNEDGISFNPNEIIDETYSFEYGGIKISFKPDEFDTFKDVKSRLSGIKLTSTYNAPTEETAVFAEFPNNNVSFASDAEVENYLKQNNTDTKYILQADPNGLSLTDKNGSLIPNSTKTWADLGITNWGDGSSDIWNDKVYHYEFTQADGSKFEFDFSVVNETSMDSVIQAFNNVQINANNTPQIENHAEVVLDNPTNLKKIEVKDDTTNITLEEEYELGRDYSASSDVFGEASIIYDSASNTFSISYAGVNDIGNGTTNKTYTNTATVTNNLINNIRTQITNNIDGYMDLITQRYIAGVKNPTDVDLASIVGSSSVTGNGATTIFTDAFTFNGSDSNLKSTLAISGQKSYAGAKIDFSGLGTAYNLMDLMGSGFNTTCETCSNHYSLQFTVPAATNTTWSEVEIDGNKYKYSLEKQGSNYTLYVDLESMMKNNITNGVDFTNKLVDVLDAAGYDFHFTQYATDKTTAELYVFDNRTQYVDGNGNSIAKQAQFEPYAYSLNSVAKFQMSFADKTDNRERVLVGFEYDWKDLVKNNNLDFDVVENNTSGLYVLNTNSNQYELYDASNQDHLNYTRYDIKDINLDTGTDNLNTYINNYIKNTIFGEITTSAKMQLVSDSAKYSLSGDANANKAMITTFSKPTQEKSDERLEKEEENYLRIQCSSNAIDHIKIKKQTLSLSRMGLRTLNTLTRDDALKAISDIDSALGMVNRIRSTFGAFQNSLEHAYAQNLNVGENTTAAESQIRDTNMAEEMVRFSNSNILAQAGQAMLAQANQTNQGVLALLN